MLKKLSLACLTLLLMLGGAKTSLSETVIEKVARTGVLTVGSRLDLIPYSYINDKEELDGYSLTVVNLIREEIEKQLGKPIKIEIIEAKGVTERIPKLVMGEIDISCDTVFTWERDKFVDFSVSYGISGVRLLVPKNSSLGSAESLEGKRIAIIPQTIIEDTIKLVQPKATLVTVKSFDEGVQALKAEKVDAIAGDTVILDGERQRLGSEGYKLVPQDPYARYGIACMVPEDNSTFLNLVNYSIAKFMQGYLIGDQKYQEMVNRWIGPEGIVNIVKPDAVKEFFEYTIMTREQIPLSGESTKQ